jgi:two-component system, cell cycle sensor histidine kinase and response regulator CckA
VTPERTPELEVASLSGEVDAVMRAIVDRLMALPGADGACLSTLHGDTAFFRVCAGTDTPLEGRTFRLDETLGAVCIERGDLTVLRRTTGPEVDRCLTPGAASIVLAPVDWNGKTRGILGVRSADTDAFDENGVEKIRMLAAGASIALRNAEVVAALAASERKYRELHDGAADAVLVTHRSDTILDANDAAASLLEYTVAELRTMKVSELFSPAELTALPLRDEELTERGALRSERPFLRKDGTEVMVEYSCRVLGDGRVHTTLRDVTQRRRNEERLRTNLGRLHAIVQTQQEISALELDQDAVTTTLVQRAQRLAGGDGAAVQWFEDDAAVYVHCSGIATPHVGLRIERAGSLAGLAALVGEALYSSDTVDDPRVDADACARLGVRSLVCAPLYHDGQVQGTLSVLSRHPHAFDELALETVRMMAEFVSSVTRNAAELETRRRLVERLETQGLVVRHMQTALWVFHVEHEELRLDYANAASEAATGLVAADIVGQTIDEVLPAAADDLKAVLRQVHESGLPVDAGEVEYGDARIRPGIFNVRAFPLAGDRVAVTFDNVTEIARSRRALQESESRFRGAFHSSAVGMALTALDGTFVQVNERLAELLGYTTDELMQLGVQGITHPDDLPIDLEHMRQLRAGEIDEFEREKRYLRKDGSPMWAHLTVSLVRGYDGAPTHVVSHIQDITAQKEANLLFQATFEQSVVPKFVCDDERRLVRVNRAAAELLGVDRETALALRVDDLFESGAVETLWPQFIDAGTMEAEAWFRIPSGATRRVEFVATANVQPGTHIAVVRDLTRQKDLEAQLRQAQKMEAVGRLAGGIAHDFNNLLTAISGYSEFLIDGEEDERLRRHAEEIKKAAARAAALTGQLLAFSRRQVLQPRVLDLNDVVGDMDMMLRRLIGEDVELVTMLDPDLACVRADPTQIEQVIVNLAVNARDAMPHGGSVTIETSNVTTGEGAFVDLRLTDTGVGMTEAERQQLFDPFFTTKEGGTGLGLATVYGIVEQSGGTIEVDSSPGHGSSFRILLPAVETPAATRQQQMPAEAPPHGTETILLVEDEQIVRRLVAEILESNGYTVLQAVDGPSALELLRRHTSTVDLLVSDVVMPGMSGPEVANAVSAMRPGMQVLYISGYTDSAIGHHGVLEPGIAFLQKPFGADDLTRAVRAILDEARVSVA